MHRPQLFMTGRRNVYDERVRAAAEHFYDADLLTAP
jgi:hypothetical protein